MESALHGNVPFLHNSSMRYIEVSFKVLPLQPASEILVAELGDLDFESFVEQEDGLLAYIQEENFDVKLIKNLFVIQSPEFQITFSYKAIEDQNWNAKWESEYEPVLIEN
jgi:ribosomal protein L11 methyltransferase